MITVPITQNPHFPAVGRPVTTVFNGGGNIAFVFYVDDCNDPDVYLVLADNIDDATDVFLDSDPGRKATVIEPFEYGDYDIDEQPQNGNGQPVDVEAVVGFELPWDRAVLGGPPGVEWVEPPRPLIDVLADGDA